MHLLRKTLLDDLHDHRGIADFRLRDEYMKVFGHNDISVDDEAIFSTRFFQEIDESISTFRCAQDRLASIAATGDEMQVLRTVVAMEPSRHWVRLAGMGALDCDNALGQLVMKSPHIAKSAMCGAPATLLTL